MVIKVSKYAVYEFLINGTVYCGFAKFQYNESEVREIVKLYLNHTTDRVYHPPVIEDYKKYKKYDGFKIIETFDFREEAEELTQRLRNEETRPSYNRKTNKKIFPPNKGRIGDDAIIEHFKNKIRELFDSEENLSLSVSEIIMKINPRLIGSSPNYIHTAINFLHKEGYLISDDYKRYKKYNKFKEVLRLPSHNGTNKKFPPSKERFDHDAIIGYIENKIMELFDSEENLVLSVSEIARRIGHPNSDERGTNYHNYPVHNVVNSLVKRGYLCKDSNGSKTQVYLPTTNAPPLP
ncbi:MAG: hypothetical protein CfClM3_0590 [Methanobrevibacter sp. CfCl-M3]